MFPSSRRIPSLAILAGLLALSCVGVVEWESRSAADSPRDLRNHGSPTEAPPSAPAVPRPDPARLPVLSASLPPDLPSSKTGVSDEMADTFSWNTFIALNWPSAPDGSPDLGQLPGQQGDNPTVWETWPEASRIFRPDGRPPAPWGTPPGPEDWPPELSQVPAGTRVLLRTGKDLSVWAPEAAAPAPLIDQNGRYVRLEIRLNRPAFDALRALRLDLREGIESAAPVSFPAGRATPPTTPGAIRIQAAWKILSPAEAAAGRFHAIRAVVYTPAASPGEGPGVIEHVTAGLVGLHIVRKTPSAPGWIWSSFEHVDNCPTAGEPADRAAYNFYDKTAPALPVNQPPARPWNPAAVEPPSRRAQIVRQIPIPVATRALSAAYQAALRAINPASPWQYYELIGTQRRSPSGDTPAQPGRLANTTLETYLATAATPAASCIDCHAQASAASGVSSDFSFLPHLAR